MLPAVEVLQPLRRTARPPLRPVQPAFEAGPALRGLEGDPQGLLLRLPRRRLRDPGLRRLTVGERVDGDGPGQIGAGDELRFD